MPIKHAFISGKADGADPDVVRPSNWNDDHEGLVIVRKSLNETLTSDTGLQDDDDLFFPMAADEVWVFELLLLTTGASTGDIKITFVGPGGETIEWAGLGLTITATDGTDIGIPVMKQSGVSGAWGTVVGDIYPLRLWGMVANGATPGDCKLRWAQNASNAVSTAVQANSWLKAYRL